MAEDTLALAIVGVVAIAAIAGFFALALLRSGSGSTGSVAVLDPDGRLLYEVTDSQLRRRAPLVPLD